MSSRHLSYPSVDQDFNDVLLEQLKRTPWILISGALHVALVIVLMLFMSGPTAPEEHEVAGIETDNVIDEEEIVETPEPPEEIPELEEELETTVPTEFDETHDETDVDSDAEETFGESDLEAEAKLTSTSNNESIGVGGAIGGGNGAGGRMKRKRRGGRRQSEICVTRGLEWLARHQSPDGSWDADGFCCKDGGCACLEGSRGGPLYDTGVTGLALLAFLGAGESPRNGVYKNNVARGVRWLMRRQDSEGCFDERSGSKLAYNQAIATLAIIESYEMTRMPSLKTSASRGLAFCMSMQNPYKGWRYGVATGKNDVSVTGWMAMVMKAAKNAKLAYDTRRVGWVLDYIDEMTDEESGRVGYIRTGEPTVREKGKVEEFPATESEAMTAVGICTRIFLGENPRNSKEIKLATENLLLKKRPVWDKRLD